MGFVIIYCAPTHLTPAETLKELGKCQRFHMTQLGIRVLAVDIENYGDICVLGQLALEEAPLLACPSLAI